jgi:apolipoprotein D and lipocalin family protein
MLMALLVLVVATAAHAQSAPPVTTVDRVDLERYAGKWYEVARFPNRFQDQCVGDVAATYMRRPDGRIDVLNECRAQDGSTDTAKGVARIVDEQSNARLKVRFAPAFLSFLPFVWGDYWIIGLADDYSWATVGSPDRKYLWILSRTPRLDADGLTAARARAAANGFEIDRLVATPQSGTDGAR